MTEITGGEMAINTGSELSSLRAGASVNRKRLQAGYELSKFKRNYWLILFYLLLF